jgi:electron-transferring-flavoprotein dehydrogenase
MLFGIGLGGLDMWANELVGRSLFGTLKHGKPDHEALKPVDQVKPIIYPKPDGVLTFAGHAACDRTGAAPA